MAKKKQSWFRKVRGSYLANSWQGYVIYLIYLAYIIVVPLLWYKDGHDMPRLFLNVIPILIGSAVLTQFIASKNS